MKFTISKTAKTALTDIYIYGYINFGEAAADKYYSELHRIFELLAVNPEMGRNFMDLRRHEHKNHIIFYEMIDDGIIITALYHKSEDIIRKLFSPD